MMNGVAKAGALPFFDIAGINWRANDSRLKVLVGYVNAGAGAYSCLREPGSSTDYVVPANKSFKCLMMIVRDVSASASGNAIGYADTAATWAGGAAPTTPIFSVGGVATVRRNVYVLASTIYEVPLLNFNIPTGKYPFVNRDAAGESSFYIIGYEE